jgi:hypothetical protein
MLANYLFHSSSSSLRSAQPRRRSFASCERMTCPAGPETAPVTGSEARSGSTTSVQRLVLVGILAALPGGHARLHIAHKHKVTTFADQAVIAIETVGPPRSADIT